MAKVKAIEETSNNSLILLNKYGSDGDRTAVTLSLNKGNYLKLKGICDKKKAKVSRIIDDLIVNFLNDLPGTKADK